MGELLFLCHRIPYPPNKGDKIRSWHVLRHLASKHTVHLACFVDSADDWMHRETLQRLCGESYFERLESSPMRWRNLIGLAGGKSVTQSHFESAALRRWLEQLAARHRITTIYVFSSAMAQYLPAVGGRDIRRIIDFVDLDSEKWRQYARNRKPPLRWIYDLEARRLSAFEREVAQGADVALFVTDGEAESFKRAAPESSAKVTTIRNGVDTDYFSPERAYDSPFGSGTKAIVFTGAMSYWANEDAVTWFATAAFPGVREEEPRAEFWIVGAGPTQSVKKLARLPGVKVTGEVPDVRPYISHAAAVVVPMRIGRGVQNKILEAMAMAKAVVASDMARSGLDAAATGGRIHAAVSPAEFGAHLIGLLRDSGHAAEMGSRARAWVIAEYGWGQNLRRLDEIVA
jgi:sugar transferase (PEP-CTERM/EpsH1 system associated)